MPKRQIVKIDEEKCTGCGLCVPACAEGALQVVDGKARLVKEGYCDGLGACLGDCPEGAITIEERHAEAFDEEAVAAHVQRRQQGSFPLSPKDQTGAHAGSCPGSLLQTFDKSHVARADASPSTSEPAASSRLGQWPVQLSLVPSRGDLWDGAEVLICADCVPYAMADFHDRLLAGKSVAVGCPKLDRLDVYVTKLTEIFAHNSIRSVTVAHMEVPCCSGIVMGVREALQNAGKTDMKFEDIEVGVQGGTLSRPFI